MSLVPRRPLPNDAEWALLRAATLADARGVHAWRTLVDGFDVDALAPEAHELLPLLADNLARIDPGAADLPRVQGLRRHVWSANQLALASVGAAVGDLDSACIPTAVVGAAATALLPDADTAARRIHTPRVLVPAAAWHEARQALAKTGWTVTTPLPARPEAVTMSFTTERAGMRVAIARASSPALNRPGADGTAGVLWRSVLTVPARGHTVALTGSGVALAVECVDSVTTHGSVRLSSLAVAHALVARADLDWETMIEFAVEQGASRLVLDGLMLVRDLLDVQIPSPVRTRLAAAPTRPRDRVARRLYELPAFRVPILGGAVDTVGRAIADTAVLPLAKAIPCATRIVAAQWGINSWSEAPATMARKATRARRAASRR